MVETDANRDYNFLMLQLLRRGSQGYEMYCHDLEVMGLNPGWVEFGVRITSIKARST